MKRIALILGTRPEAIKMVPVYRALRASANFDPFIIATGQHRELVRPTLADCGIRPEHEMNLMQKGQTLNGFGAELLRCLPRIFQAENPDLVLVQGDTASALFGAQTAFGEGIRVGHIEAGLRTGNLASPFPEEGFRAMISQICAIHFAPTTSAAINLRRNGIRDECVTVTGNTVIDALLHEREHQTRTPEVADAIDRQIRKSLGDHWRLRPFVLVTGHRRENFGQGMQNICEALLRLAEANPETQFVYPVHLNPNVRDIVYEQLGGCKNIRLIEPQAYRPFVALMAACRLVLTDSGGIQEEAPSFGKPVLVMRENTERPEGVDAGTVRLVGTHSDSIFNHVQELLHDPTAYETMSQTRNPYGDGDAALKIVRALDRSVPNWSEA